MKPPALQVASRRGPDPIDVAVGARIRILRRRLKMTQKDLATVVGVTFQQVHRYELGDNRISARTLLRAARALGTSVSALVGEGEPPHSAASIATALRTRGAMDLLAAYAAITGGRPRPGSAAGGVADPTPAGLEPAQGQAREGQGRRPARAGFNAIAFDLGRRSGVMVRAPCQILARQPLERLDFCGKASPPHC